VLSFSDRLKSTSLTTVSKLHIAYGVVQVSAWMVGILLHSCSQRQHSNDLQLVCRLSRVNDDEISNELRCAPVRIVDGGHSAEADARSDKLQIPDSLK
jgi:hypothetical protein